MSIEQSPAQNKPTSLEDVTHEFKALIQHATQNRLPLHEVEPLFLKAALKMGCVATEQYLAMQGNGDLGETITSPAGHTLVRSPEPVERPLRTIFDTHVIHAYVYSRGPKTRVELRPIDARLALPPSKFSYFYEQFSQYFCVDSAFGLASQGLEMVLGKTISVDSLEHTNRRVGEQANDYLPTLPTPPRAEEGELLVLTADGKGVPLVKADAQRVAAFEEQPERPGNRRMATVVGVYSVDRHVRTPEDIVAALFRDKPLNTAINTTYTATTTSTSTTTSTITSIKKVKRPEPKFKHVAAFFPREYEDGDTTITSTGAIEAFSWAAGQVETRRAVGQKLLKLMDGQSSLWSTANLCIEIPAAECVEILDILHAAGYVWRAAKVFYSDRKQQEGFARERLLRILRGEVRSVIAGMRQRGTKQKLTGAAKKELATVCNYLENNAERMKYDEYLAAGYPIATGVIEGACRHLVKDRMERSGMRWRLESARSMLNVRAVFQSSYWDEFQVERIRREQAQLLAGWQIESLPNLASLAI